MVIALIALLTLAGLGLGFVAAQEPRGAGGQDLDTAMELEPEEELEEEYDAAVEEEEGYVYQDEVVIRKAIEEVLADPAFSRLRDEPEETEEDSGWLDSFLEWLSELIGPLVGPGEGEQQGLSFPGLNILVYSGAALVLAIAIALLLRGLVRSPSERNLRPESEAARLFRADSTPGAIAPEEYWARSEQFATAGDYRSALRELLLGAMSAIERRGAMRHRPGLTSRDYVRAVRGTRRDSMECIVGAFEYVYFGRRRATAESFERAASAFRASFLQAVPATAEEP
jgi:hypothetical protein